MGILLLLPIVLPAYSAAVNQKAGYAPMGVLAYIQDGDLWVKELPRGRAKRLAANGRNWSPRWSPSGRWLAYRKDDQLWIARGTGTEAKVLNGGAVVNAFAWSPTSDTLAYAPHTGGLRAASAGQWYERELAAGEEMFKVAWSPDGTWLAYVQGRGESKRYAGLWRVRADGRDAAELFNTGIPAMDGLEVAGWSRDGKRIFFWVIPDFSSSVSADGLPLKAIPARGGRPVEITREMLLYCDFWDVSPRGKLLAIAEGIGRETWLHKRIVVVDLTDGRRTYLTDEKTAAFSPAWSPDGRRIVYVAAKEVHIGDFDTKILDKGSGSIVFQTPIAQHLEPFWVPILKHFENHRRVITYERREGTTRYFHAWNRAKDLKLVLDYLGIERCDFISHSSGSIATLHFALMYPDRVNSLVLMNVAAFVST